MIGFVKLNRSDATREILRDPKAFALLALIACRARWSTGLSVHSLEPGQAFIGDYRECGLRTQKEYRMAKARLVKYRLAAFKGTNKGTVATLLNSDVFDILREPKGKQEGKPKASQGRAKGKPGATNEEGKKGKKGKEYLPEENRKAASAGLPGHQVDYQEARIPSVSDYDDDVHALIHNHPDPIEAAISITGETGKRSWGHWVKILNKARKDYGPDRAERLFRDSLAELAGEIRAGEVRKPGAIFNRKLESILG